MTKKLPDFIKNSIEAYVACLSGAIIKDEYIEAIKAAGFQEVRIIDETPSPAEFMANDPAAKAMTKNLGIPLEQVKEIAGSVISIKL